MSDTITEQIVIGVVPGAGPDNQGGTLTSPIQEQIATVQADPTRQYIAGSPNYFVTSYLQTLPPYHGDLEASFGRERWRKMMYSPVLWSAVQNLRFHILAPELSLLAAEDLKEGEDGFALQQEILEFSVKFLNSMDRPYKRHLYEALDCLFESYTVAEKEYSLADADHDYRHYLQSLKVKPQEVVGFVVDPYLDVKGFVGISPAVGTATGTVAAYYILQPLFIGDNDRDLQNVLPRDKCTVMTYYPDKQDPRGWNPLRAAYNPWWTNQQTWGAIVQTLAQFGGASVVGICGEGEGKQRIDPLTGQQVTDPLTGKPIYDYPQDTMLAALQQLVAGSAIAVPHDSKVEAFFVPGAVENLMRVIEACDRQQVLALTGQTRATMEAEHGSKADSAGGKDIMDQVVNWGRFVVEQYTHYEVLKPAIAINFGAAAIRYTPKVTMGDSAAEDFKSNAPGVAQLEKAGYLDPSQRPYIDANVLNIPVRTAEEVEARRKRMEQPPPVPGAPGQQQDGNEEDGGNDQGGGTGDA